MQASGIVVFARSSESRTRLLPAFTENRAAKRFIAVVHGRPSWKQADCDLPLVPNGNKLHKTIIDKYRGKHAYTHFQVLTQAGNYTVLEAVPQTDCVHQIRVHLCAMGHPLVCDSLYGSLKAVYLSSFKHNWHGDPLEERPLLARLGLHALELTLPDVPPLTAPLTQDMKAVITQIEKRSGQQLDGDLLARADRHK
ncbi:hypothetical protein FACS1894200_03250 [Spirochaetia bacterium]|nr:hypothetical protein FACS1894200_03250 [Spirochaetia bacterium]